MFHSFTADPIMLLLLALVLELIYRADSFNCTSIDALAGNPVKINEEGKKYEESTLSCK